MIIRSEQVDALSTDQTITLQNYIKKTLIIIWNEFPIILLVGFLASLSWAVSMLIGILFDQPLLVFGTIPFLFFPVLSGVFYITGNLTRGISIRLMDLLRVIIKCYCRSIFLGIIIILPYLLLIGTWKIYVEFSQEKWLWVPLVVQSSILLISVISSIHAISFMSFYDFGIFKSIRYSWCLLARSPRETAGIMFLGFMLIFPVWWSRFGLLPVAIGAWSMFASQLTLIKIRSMKD